MLQSNKYLKKMQISLFLLTNMYISNIIHRKSLADMQVIVMLCC